MHDTYQRYRGYGLSTTFSLRLRLAAYRDTGVGSRFRLNRDRGMDRLDDGNGAFAQDSRS